SAGYLAIAATKRRRFVVSAGVHPHSRRTLETYSRGYGADVVEVPLRDGVTDAEALESALHGDGGADTAAIFLQTPNYLGAVERIEPLANLARGAGALAVVSADPISLGLLKPPGECGADVVIGEGQSLGNRLDYGGPSFGFFCATSEHMRRMPGRIAGETTDLDGRRGFVLTLQTREQHIRREKATHNICTAQALNALAGTIYLSWLGKQGLVELASAVARKTAHARERLAEVSGLELIHEAPAMREVAVELAAPVEAVIAHCAARGVLAGIPLAPDYPEHPNGLLVGISGQVTAAEVDRLAAALGDAIETVGEASPQAGATV
ncbi:MAG: glycine dehydrogenase, partial [Solirubrobacterales bacterium]